MYNGHCILNSISLCIFVHKYAHYISRHSVHLTETKKYTPTVHWISLSEH